MVGSVVAIFSSIQGLLASSTQRFLNFEHGRGNKGQLNKIFSMSVWIHIGLSLLFLIVILPIGLWIINSYLVIPENRITAANWVFVFSIFSAIVTIMTVPYNAVIIANERMNAFAYISILDGVLRLVIIYLLIYSVFDQLITYAVLLFVIGLIVRLVNMIYCHRKFEEAKQIKFVWDKQLLIQMSSFAGWQFLGNSGWAIQTQGLNMVLNVFFGPALNAARGIANQVDAALNMFVNNMMLAINPQITKLYASNNKKDFEKLFHRSSRFSFMIFIILAFPIFISTDFILNLWLVSVPSYTILFVRLILIYSLIRTLHMPLDSIIKSTGNLKTYQITDFVCLVLTIPLAYISLSVYNKPELLIIVMIVMQIIATFLTFLISHKIVGISLASYFKNVLFLCILISVVFTVFLCLSKYIALHIIIKTILMSVVFTMVVLVLGLTKSEIKSIKRYCIKRNEST